MNDTKAERLGLNPGFLRQMAKGRRKPLPETVMAIECATEGVVTREELRLDMFLAPRRHRDHE